MPFDATGRPLKERRPKQTRRFIVSQLATTKVGLGNDDHAAIADVIGQVEALGGGELLFDGTFYIGSDLTMSRKVVPVGHAESVSQIKTTGGQRRVKLTGVPADAPDWNGDATIVKWLTFDGVSLDFGPNVGDTSRGCRAFQCEFVNSDRALWFTGAGANAFAGVGAIQCKFRLCGTGIWFDNGGPAHFVIACGIDECEHASIRVNNVVADGLSLFIDSCYADHSARFLKVDGTMSGDANVYIRGGGIELCGTSDGPSQLYPSGTTYTGGQYADGGYGIENAGAQIWLDHLNFFQGTHTDALFWNKSGVIYVNSGRYFWNNNAFCRMDGGHIIVDQSKMFSPSKLWGTGIAGPMHHPSSTAGSVSAPRSGFVEYNEPILTTVTNASPVYSRIIAEPYDDNDRIIEFDVQVTGIGTSNTLRCQLADGSHTILVDLQFPLVRGGAHVTIDWKRGSTWAAMAYYMTDGNAPAIAHAAGSTPTAAEFNAAVDRINGMVRACQGTASDSSAITSTRFLTLTTINVGGTASQMNIYNMRETVMGQAFLGN